jgi:hypothetical protein
MCVSGHDLGATITVKVFPKSSKNEILAPRNNALIVRLTAPPSDGKANKALVKILAKALSRPVSSIEIIKGETAREKLLLIYDMSENQTRSALGL